VGLERGTLSLVKITEELFQGNSGSGPEINGRGDPLHWLRDTIYPQNFALTSITSGGRSVGIVRLRTKQRHIFEGGKLDIEVGRDEIGSRTENIKNSVFSSKYKLQSHPLLL
jgi:hypothetical protein